MPGVSRTVRWATLLAVAVMVLGLTSVLARGRSGTASAADRRFPCGTAFPNPPSARTVSVSTVVPARFGLFRRTQLPADANLEAAFQLRKQLGEQLMSYDPALTRHVHAPPVKKLFGTHAGYIVVGRGAADEFTLKTFFPCARKLSPARRRLLQRGLDLLRVFRPAGLTYCFVETFQPLKPPATADANANAECSTFQDVQSGYGMNEIIGGPSAPSLAGLVPDPVAAVVLRYRHRTIQTAVTENVFWTRVPRLPPIQSAVGKSPPARVLREQVLAALPSRIEWRARDGRLIRSFTPPPGYVRLLVRRDQICIAIDCGR